MLSSRLTYDGPTPLERPLDYEEVGTHRHMGCGRYSMCLEVVVRRQWISFSCRFCSLWERGLSPEPPPPPARPPARVLFLPALGQR
jgi:hypothetical protein